MTFAERMQALAPAYDDSDWLDVRRRARRDSRRWLALPLAAAVAALLVGSALAVYSEVVDFFSAEPAPERVVVDFGRLGVNSRIRMSGPDVVAGEARKITDVTIGGKRQALYVTPTAEGGFCWRWGTTGSCGRIGLGPGVLGVTWLDSPGGPAEIRGHLLDAKTRRLELTYEDGDRVEIPFVWVSPPIDAGFYAFEVPSEHRRIGHRAKVLVALDEDGEEIQRQVFGYTDPRWESGPDGLPRIADRSRKRTLFDFRDHKDNRRTLVTAPAPGGRLCYAYNRGSGCLSEKHPAVIGGMTVQSGNAATVCCAVAEGVATVELRYQDGDRTQHKPVARFLLYAIPPKHYPPGHRLERIVWRDGAGRQVATRSIDTGPGIYPCTKAEERKLDYGVRICP